MSLVDSLKQIVTGKPPVPTLPAFPYSDWPPKSEEERLNGYKKYQAIYDAEPNATNDKNLISDKELYIIANLPRLVCTIPSDLMLGEPFSLSMDEDQKNTQEILDEIIEKSDLQTTAYEMSVSAGILGDQILIPEKDADGVVTIRIVSPHVWFPQRNPDNIREVLVHRLCWVRTVEVDKVKVDLLRVIEHTKGLVRNRLFELKAGKVLREVPIGDKLWSLLYNTETMPEPEQETGVDDFLVVHVPNTRLSNDFYGRSDLKDLISLVSAIYARLSQTNAILRRHSDPPIIVPPAMFAWLRSMGMEGGTQGALTVDPALLAVQRMGDNGEKSEYMTWDGKIENNLEFLKELRGLVFMLAEIDRQLVEGIEGTPSGIALRTLLVRTLAKVNRKWKYVKRGLEQALILAAQLQGVKLDSLRIDRSDGLPADTVQDVDIAIKKIDGGLSTHLREIMQLEDMDKDEAQELLDEIEANKASERDELAKSFIKAKVGAGVPAKQPNQPPFGKQAA